MEREFEIMLGHVDYIDNAISDTLMLLHAVPDNGDLLLVWHQEQATTILRVGFNRK